MKKLQSNKLFVMVKVYNEYEMLEDLVQTLIKQTFRPAKVKIIDDGSPKPEVAEEVNKLATKYPQINIELLRLPLKEKPNLDTAGRTYRSAWLKEKGNQEINYVGIIDADTRLESRYYERIIERMGRDRKIACASGSIIVQGRLEKINIGARFGRKDARGSGKVIRASFLREIEDDDFPEVDWDTWINTKAKCRKMKAIEIEETYMIQERPTSRVARKDLYRNGRLTYHFGYNPILLLSKVLLAGLGGREILKGYLKARNRQWRLKDKEVRKYFGWKFFRHF